jgi:lipopolysaccharide export system permease protein
MEAEMERMLVTIILNEGTLHNAEDQDNQVIRFKRYQLQISLRPPTEIGGEDVTTQTRGSMTQQQLLQAAAKQGVETKSGRVFLSEYHHRLILPVGCFILSLLGLPLGLQAGPGKRALGLPLGLAFFLLYYIAFTTTRVMSEEGRLPLVLGMWLPNILFLVLTLGIFWRVEQEKPLFSERLQLWFSSGFNRYLKPVCECITAWSRRMCIKWRLRQPTATKAKGEERHLLIHADGTTGIFHLPACEQYHCPHCRIEFKDTTIAKEAGFEPCGFCKTLLEQQDQQTTSSN